MATAKFLLNWKVGLLRFKAVDEISKMFVVAYKNVSFQWKAILEVMPDETNIFYFRLCFDDGPLADVQDIDYTVGLIRPDKAAVRIGKSGSMMVPQSVNVSSWCKLVLTSRQIELQLVATPTNGDQIFLQIELGIPTSIFSYSLEFPFVDVAQPWLFDLFERIDDHENKFDIELISCDGMLFYGHKFVLCQQSTALAAMFRNPQTEDEKNGVCRFPTLTKEGLKRLLQYLYTGLTEIGDLSVIDIIEVAHAAEQYQLQKLVQSCDANLWKRVVVEPGKSMEIMRYANLRGVKYLKHRAMDVLVENLDEIPFSAQQFGTDQLNEEFAQYCTRRVTISSIQAK